MPGYIYTHPETGERRKLIMSVREMLNRTKKWDGEAIELDGVVWSRCVGCEHERVHGTSKGWPMTSESAGTHPDEVPRMMEETRKRGVNLNYTSDGRAIFENSAHRKAAMKALGLRDRQGFD
jgi:hypothetical protein